MAEHGYGTRSKTLTKGGIRGNPRRLEAMAGPPASAPSPERQNLSHKCPGVKFLRDFAVEHGARFAVAQGHPMGPGMGSLSAHL